MWTNDNSGFGLVDLLGVDFCTVDQMGVDVMGEDVMGVDILKFRHYGTTPCLSTPIAVFAQDPKFNMI